MKPRILIVEDEKIIALDLTMRLEELGYIVVSAVSNGPDAILAVDNNQLDVVLMDINLEGEMDGIEAATIIKSKINLPVIFITAFADELTFRNASSTDPYAYVLKPFQTRELDFTIRTAINQHGLKIKLLESESRYRNLFESSRFAIAIIDNYGQVKEFNKAAKVLLGYLNIKMATELASFFPADAVELVNYKWKKFLENQIFKGKYTITLANNKTLFFEYSIQPDVFDNQHLLMVRNITPLVEARRNVEYLAQLQQESPHPVMRIGLNGNIIYSNPSAQTICRTWLMEFGNQVPNEVLYTLSNLNSGHTEEIMVVNVGLKTYSLRLVYIPKEVYINIYFTEITELKQTEKLTNIQKDLVEMVAKGFLLSVVLEQLSIQLSEFLGNAPSAIFVCEADHCSVRESYAHLLPYNVLSEIAKLGKSDERSILRKAIENKVDLFEELLVEKEYPEIEVFLAGNDLNYGMVHPVYNKEGELLGCLMVLLKREYKLSNQELTMIQMASKVLTLCATRDKAMNSLYKQAQVFENMYDAIILTDSNNNIRELNPVTEKLFGYTKQQLLGKDVLSLKLFDKKQKLDKLIRYASDAQKKEEDNGSLKFVDELQFTNQQDEPGVAEVTVIAINSGGNQPSGTLIVVRDVTNSKKVESALSSSESKLVALVENTDDLIFSLDKELRLITCNTATRNFYVGYLGSDITPGDIFDLPNLPILAQKLIEQFKTTLNGESIRQEIHLPVSSGFYFSVASNPIYSAEGIITGISVFTTDVTKRKMFEIELSRTNFELDSFVYRASHDLRAPLRSILGLINVISIETNPDLKFNYVKLIEKSVNKLDKFISDLTDFSRNSRLEIKAEAIDFEHILQEIIENLRYMEGAAETNITIEKRQSAILYSDNARLEIVLQNLVSNAIKYRNPDTESKLEITIENDVNHANIIFSDNGKGIKAEYINKIFDMFYRASEDSYGSGLGLYITKQVAEKLGGSIDVHSELGVGTTFKLSIPNFTERALAQQAALVTNEIA
jgi:PAS domain S-box-containing protein